MEFLFKLKWLNGPLAGRELNLPAGEMTIGGDDPDIALPLEDGVQAVITTSTDGVTLSPAIPVWVEGMIWDTGQPLPLAQVIDMAGLGFILGEPASELPSVPLPARIEPQSEEKPRKSWRFWTGCALAFALPVALGISIHHFAPEPPPAFNVQHWLEETLQASEFAGLAAHMDEYGKVKLTGITAHAKDTAHLRQLLSQHHLLVQDESMAADSLRLMVRQLLATYGYQDAEVVSGHTLDSIEIHGNIQADANWQATTARLNQIRALGSWRVINDQEELFQSLLETLQQQKLMEGLSIAVVGKDLMVNGQLSQKQEKKVVAALDAFNNEKQPRLRAKFLNIPTQTRTADILPSAVVSVGGSSSSAWLQLANGMRLQTGAILPGNYRIYALSHQSMTFIRGQRLISVPLNIQ
jgi:type III secretion protein D